MRTAELLVGGKKDHITFGSLTAAIKERIKKALELPDSIGVLMQKFREFGLENKGQLERNKEALRLYPLFVSRYRDGIRNYQTYANSRGLEFRGVIENSTYPNQELRVYPKSQECVCVYSTKTQNDNGSQGDHVEIVGSLDGKSVHLVTFGRWKDGVEIQGATIWYSSDGNLSKEPQVR
jgi:hypothetical protein